MAKKPASGMYKTKARNLTDAQLKRAKGASAAGKRTVSVSATSRATTGENKGYTLGAGGKRLTGTVIMANGDRAVYKGGKRVTNVPKSSLESRGGTSRTNSVSETVDTTKSRKSAELTIAQRKKMGKGRTNFETGARRKTGLNKIVSPSKRGEGSQLIWNENSKKWMVK